MSGRAPYRNASTLNGVPERKDDKERRKNVRKNNKIVEKGKGRERKEKKKKKKREKKRERKEKEKRKKRERKEKEKFFNHHKSSCNKGNTWAWANHWYCYYCSHWHQSRHWHSLASAFSFLWVPP